MPLERRPRSVSRIHFNVSALTPWIDSSVVAGLVVGLTPATAEGGRLVAGAPAGVAFIVEVAADTWGARIPELAIAAAEGRGGSAAIPVGTEDADDPPVLGLVVFPPGPTVAQTPPDAAGATGEGTTF